MRFLGDLHDHKAQSMLCVDAAISNGATELLNLDRRDIDARVEISSLLSGLSGIHTFNAFINEITKLPDVSQEEQDKTLILFVMNSAFALIPLLEGALISLGPETLTLLNKLQLGRIISKRGITHERTRSITPPVSEAALQYIVETSPEELQQQESIRLALTYGPHKRVMIVDEYHNSGDTCKVAQAIANNAFPEAEILNTPEYYLYPGANTCKFGIDIDYQNGRLVPIITNRGNYENMDTAMRLLGFATAHMALHNKGK